MPGSPCHPVTLPPRHPRPTLSPTSRRDDRLKVSALLGLVPVDTGQGKTRVAQRGYEFGREQRSVVGAELIGLPPVAALPHQELVELVGLPVLRPVPDLE